MTKRQTQHNKTPQGGPREGQPPCALGRERLWGGGQGWGMATESQLPAEDDLGAGRAQGRWGEHSGQGISGLG